MLRQGGNKKMDGKGWDLKMLNMKNQDGTGERVREGVSC